MLSRRRLLLASPGLLCFTQVGAAAAKTKHRHAAHIADMLPAARDVPKGMVQTLDGQRTLSQVADGYADPAGARKLFRKWGWKGTVVRDFGLPDGATPEAGGISFIHVSIHRFSDAAGAQDALNYAVDDHKTTTTAHEEGGIPLGDASRVLFEKTAQGSESTIYVQRGTALVRLTVLSPAGDPTETAFTLAKTILAK